MLNLPPNDYGSRRPQTATVSIPAQFIPIASGNGATENNYQIIKGSTTFYVTIFSVSTTFNTVRTWPSLFRPNSKHLYMWAFARDSAWNPTNCKWLVTGGSNGNPITNHSNYSEAFTCQVNTTVTKVEIPNALNGFVEGDSISIEFVAGTISGGNVIYILGFSMED